MEIIKTKWVIQYVPRLTSKISCLYMAQNWTNKLVTPIASWFCKMVNISKCGKKN